jgi:putative protein kinase ArgK-like GTPase of G3E family
VRSARAATWVENARPEAQQLLKEMFPRTGRAMILGVTGPPGAGKSTLCDQLTRALRAEGKTVGVIAVDPTSPYTGGAILGDRIRMQQHHDDPDVFIPFDGDARMHGRRGAHHHGNDHAAGRGGTRRGDRRNGGRGAGRSRDRADWRT